MIRKIKIITIISGIVAAITGKAVADSIELEPWYPQHDQYTQFWFNWSGAEFDPYSFLESITLPFTNAIGYWFFVVLWGAYLFGVWNRAMSIELIVIAMLILGPLWGFMLPPESYPIGYICLAIGISAIVFKLFKK